LPLQFGRFGDCDLPFRKPDQTAATGTFGGGIAIHGAHWSGIKVPLLQDLTLLCDEGRLKNRHPSVGERVCEDDFSVAAGHENTRWLGLCSFSHLKMGIGALSDKYSF